MKSSQTSCQHYKCKIEYNIRFKQNLSDSDCLPVLFVLKSELESFIKSDSLEKASNIDFFRKVVSEYRIFSTNKLEFKSKDYHDLEVSIESL